MIPHGREIKLKTEGCPSVFFVNKAPFSGIIRLYFRIQILLLRCFAAAHMALCFIFIQHGAHLLEKYGVFVLKMLGHILVYSGR